MKATCVLALLGILGGTLDSHAASVTFSRQSRLPTGPEIANDPALAGRRIIDYFLTSSGDILSISNVTINIGGSTNGSQLYQHALGSEVEAPLPLFVDIFPALGADSWITTPGATAIAGNGFSGTDGAWFDTENLGPQSNFLFARLTVPDGAPFLFSGRVAIPSDDNSIPVYFPIVIPEPASAAMSGISLLALALLRRSRRHAPRFARS
jgi:hypothetical protein